MANPAPKFRFFRTTLLLALSLSGAQAKAIDFTGLGGLNYAAPTERRAGNDLHWTGDAGFSYGLTAAVPVFLLPLEVETGVFMIQESSSRDLAHRKTRMLQIPLVVRFNLDEHIGLGIGGYLAFRQGQVDATSVGDKSTDSGLLLNVRARFNLAPPFYFIIDARYQHGLANRAIATNDLYHTRSVQAFAGFQFALLTSHDE